MTYYATIEADIEKYYFEKNKVLRVEIFEQNILPFLVGLTDNLMNVYEFKVIDKVLFKQDCVKYLSSKVNKYDPCKKSCKAFSYFNVVAKCWMVNQRRDYNGEKKK